MLTITESVLASDAVEGLLNCFVSSAFFVVVSLASLPLRASGARLLKRVPALLVLNTASEPYTPKITREFSLLFEQPLSVTERRFAFAGCVNVVVGPTWSDRRSPTPRWIKRFVLIEVFLDWRFASDERLRIFAAVRFGLARELRRCFGAWLADSVCLESVVWQNHCLQRFAQHVGPSL